MLKWKGALSYCTSQLCSFKKLYVVLEEEAIKFLFFSTSTFGTTQYISKNQSDSIRNQS